jgi:hypothetical protein
MLPLWGVLSLSHSQTEQRLILWFSIQIFAVVSVAQCLQFFPADDVNQKAGDRVRNIFKEVQCRARRF